MYVGVGTQCVCVVVGFPRDSALVARRAVAKSSFGSVQTVDQVTDLVSYFGGQVFVYLFIQEICHLTGLKTGRTNERG